MTKKFKTPLAKLIYSRKYYKNNIERRREIARKASAKYRELYPEKAKKSQLKWNANNPEKLLRIERRRQAKRYGLTLEQVEKMYEEAKGRCAGCKELFPITKRPSIDHNSKCCPGKFSCGKCVRGLLCQYCNTALGMAKDDIKILQNLIKYLRKNL